MKKVMHMIFLRHIAIPLFALLLILSPIASATALAAPSQQSSTEGFITVVGEGTVSIQPDVAVANIGVEVSGKSVLEATAQNREILQAVLDSLMEAGVAEKDIQTAGFSVYSERYGPSGPLSDDEINYRVSNNVRVKIRDLESVGPVLDAAIEAGANNIFGVDFLLEDSSDAELQAREKAIQNAQERAHSIADLSGLELGSIISVSEVIGSSGLFTGISVKMADGVGGNGTVMPGELDISYQLQVTYGIAD